MSTASLIAEETLVIEGANGVNYAYRRLGSSTDGQLPLVMLQHFRGNLDNWDPLLIDTLAAGREVIVFDNTGVGSSSGTTPSNVTEMARDAIVFIEALGLKKIDLLGFSLGGFVAQEMALIRPALIRKLVLAGTGPQGAPRMHGWRQDIEDHATVDVPGPEELLYIFFAHTETSQAKGKQFLGRFSQRGSDRDPATSLQTRDAHYDAIVEWGIPDHSKLQRLTGIRQPTLVIQGDGDLMIPTPLSHLMAGLIPDSRIRIYPDAAHAFLFQYPEDVASDVAAFLEE
jgi:pimeloyl-ACP methyl ester carboxylesterase